MEGGTRGKARAAACRRPALTPGYPLTGASIRDHCLFSPAQPLDCRGCLRVSSGACCPEWGLAGAAGQVHVCPQSSERLHCCRVSFPGRRPRRGPAALVGQIHVRPKPTQRCHRRGMALPGCYPHRCASVLSRMTVSSQAQAETSTSVHRHGRRRRHRRRHDGAVAHLSQLPAAFPHCRDLPDSSLADRAGKEPSLSFRLSIIHIILYKKYM